MVYTKLVDFVEIPPITRLKLVHTQSPALVQSIIANRLRNPSAALVHIPRLLQMEQTADPVTISLLFLMKADLEGKIGAHTEYLQSITEASRYHDNALTRILISKAEETKIK